MLRVINAFLALAVIGVGAAGFRLESRDIAAAVDSFSGEVGGQLTPFYYFDVRGGPGRAIAWRDSGAFVLARWPALGDVGAVSPVATLEAEYDPADVTFIYVMPLTRSAGEEWARRNAAVMREGAVYAADGAGLLLRMTKLENGASFYVLDARGHVVHRGPPPSGSPLSVGAMEPARAALDALLAAS